MLLKVEYLKIGNREVRNMLKGEFLFEFGYRGCEGVLDKVCILVNMFFNYEKIYI